MAPAIYFDKDTNDSEDNYLDGAARMKFTRTHILEYR